MAMRKNFILNNFFSTWQNNNICVSYGQSRIRRRATAPQLGEIWNYSSTPFDNLSRVYQRSFLEIRFFRLEKPWISPNLEQSDQIVTIFHEIWKVQKVIFEQVKKYSSKFYSSPQTVFVSYGIACSEEFKFKIWFNMASIFGRAGDIQFSQP